MRTSPAIGYFANDDEFVELPHVWNICPHCRGEGVSSAYLGAFTNSDLEEEGPEFLADYLDGVYDRSCDVCDGAGKVKVADFTSMTAEQAAAYRLEQEDEREMRAEEEMERRFGC